MVVLETPPRTMPETHREKNTRLAAEEKPCPHVFSDKTGPFRCPPRPAFPAACPLRKDSLPRGHFAHSIRRAFRDYNAGLAGPGDARLTS
jgi:hypothetical protein